jgi:hypothetical protein
VKWSETGLEIYVVECRLQVKEVERGFGRLAEQLVKEIETGLGRLAEKGPERPPERLAEQLVKEIETGLGRLAEKGVPQDENGPSRCPARWIVMAPLVPNQK